MRDDGKISQSIVALKPLGNNLEIEIQSGSFDNMLDTLGYVVGKELYILYPKTMTDKAKWVSRLPPNYHPIEIDV